MNPATKRRLGGRALDAKRRGSDQGRGEGEQLYIDPQTIFEVHRLLAQLTAGNQEHRFAELLSEVAVDGPYVEQALIYWIDLIEVLVQSTETRYTPGSGPQKKDEVKGIVMFIVRTNRLELPASVPAYLRPVLVDIGADIAVDTIVALFNQQDRLPGPNAWLPAAQRPTLSQRWRTFKHLVLRIARTILSPLARLGSFIYLRLRYPVKVSPALKAALQAIEDDSELMRNRDTVDEVVELLRTVADNADALRAGVQLVGIVVQQVERFAHLSGSQKKVYARQLTFAVLEDLGVDTHGPVTSVKLGMAVDTGIDMVVHLFNKRQVFVKGSSPPRPATVPRRR
jgi:hypothetical protein